MGSREDDASLLLAIMLVDDKKALLMWSWLHNNAQHNVYALGNLVEIGLPRYKHALLIGSIMDIHYKSILTECLSKHRKSVEYVLAYKTKCKR